MQSEFQTIAAVSTPRGKGGVAMIRISGDEAHAVAAKMFLPASGKDIREMGLRRAVYGKIYDGGELLDSGICTLYGDAASYTGEATAEICCHGGAAVTAAVLKAAFSAGAVQAGAGEFTRRAFINGRLSLTEAEAVGSLIDADTESRRRLAAKAADGALKRRCGSISEKLTATMAALYAAVDYPDEDIGDEGEREIANAVKIAAEDTEALLSTYRRGKAVMSGVPTVICGSPNCGKSSLYNAMLGEDRAIVTAAAGTTRDVLRDTVDIGGVTLLISDTAGLREGCDEAERIGVEKARRAMDEAEILLCVYDGSRRLTSEERELMSAHGAARIAVINKSDLPCALSPEDERLIASAHDAVVRISAKSGTGMDALSEEIGKLYDAGSGDDTAVVWEARQAAELSRAASLLREAYEALYAGEAPDGACTLCEAALAALGMVDGRDVTESIVSEIFSKFCVGK
jgi:tRNA modification GTPase